MNSATLSSERPPWLTWSRGKQGQTLLAASASKMQIASSLVDEWKTGSMLYDFMAASEDELTIEADQRIVILDDVTSENWWIVRLYVERMGVYIVSGKMGLVPAVYIEVNGSVPKCDLRGPDIQADAQICYGHEKGGDIYATSSRLERRCGYRHHFLSLPREIRNDIYALVFLAHPAIPMGISSFGSTNLGLLVTCKQVYAEATSLYYNLSVFDNRLWKLCTQFLLFLPPAPKDFVCNMRRKLHTSATKERYASFHERRGLLKAVVEVLGMDGIRVGEAKLKMVLETKLIGVGGMGRELGKKGVRRVGTRKSVRWGHEWDPKRGRIRGKWARCEKSGAEDEQEESVAADRVEKKESKERKVNCKMDCCLTWDEFYELQIEEGDDW